MTVSDFDEKTIQHLNYYVYLLLDPGTKQPFYVGKGKGNRVFAHLADALDETNPSGMKLDTIREIYERGLAPDHLIVRHGLTEKAAFEIEASLIDVLQFMKTKNTNIAGGHNSIEKGLMTADEIKRLYNAPLLDHIAGDCVIININRKYKRGAGSDDIYEAVKEAWVISDTRLLGLKYVLVEFHGLIVEVFEVDEWYDKKFHYTSGKKKRKMRVRRGFIGRQAPEAIRTLYLNKSIAHHKKRGQASPVRFKLP